MPHRVRKRGSVSLPPKKGGKNKRANPLPKETIVAAVEAFRLANTGRPATYSPGLDELARRFYILGYDDEDFARLLGITIATINDWTKAYPSFFHARASAKEAGDAEVEASLRERALGYSHTAEKIMLGPGGSVIREEYIQHYPPDPKSAELWLSNRKNTNSRWRDPRRDDDTDKSDTKIVIEGGLPD